MSNTSPRDQIYNLIHEAVNLHKIKAYWGGFSDSEPTPELWARISTVTSSTTKTTLTGEEKGNYVSKGFVMVEVYYAKGSKLNAKAYAFAEEVARILRSYKYKTDLWFSQVTTSDSKSEEVFERVDVTSRFNYNFRF